MHNYLFLIAWMENSDTAIDLPDELYPFGVETQEDLLPEFKRGNKNVFAVLIKFVHHLAGADLGEMASALGYKEAFFHNYTAHDSLSVVLSPYDIKDIDLDSAGAFKTIEV